MSKYTAHILLDSRTQIQLLSQLLVNLQVTPDVVSGVDDLLASIAGGGEPEIIFISKEPAIKENLSPTEFIAKLRAIYQGPIILISTDEDVKNIEYFVSSGVTDVFSLKEFEQIENFISNLVSYQDSLATIHNAKVLLVEDSKSVRSLITGLFAQHDIDVMFVPTGREALTVLHFEKVDLVITDYMLEGDMTGLALIRNIRRTTRWYSLPILAITGYRDQERSKELLRNGVSDIIYKPFDPEYLLMKCQILIQNKRTFQQLLEKQNTINELEQKDQLTGLYNRAYLTQFCERFLEDEANSHKQLFLIHLDCDDFKLVNNQVGHDEADKILSEIGTMMMQYIPKEMVIARLDGDEFAIAIADTHFDKALQVADLVRESISHHKFIVEGITVSVGVSGGNGSVKFSDFYLDTDSAVAKAKEQGKNKVVLGDLANQLLEINLTNV